MAMTLKNNSDGVMSEINTTPLIDVMLVLLTLLIITLPLQTNAVKMTLPASHLADPKPPIVIDLGVDFDGTITWNGQVVDRATLDTLLADTARQSPQSELHVNANRFAKYDTVAKVLSDAQRLGMTRIGFANTADFAK
jgi:biopolymer transport protein ExbD